MDAMPTQVSVTAVILLYQQAEEVCRVIACVKAQTRPVARIIVVDNASPNDAAGRVAAAHPDVEIIRRPENGGVGAGHNTGWAAALADAACTHIWSIEQDCFPEPECLAELLAARAALFPAGDATGVVAPVQTSPFTGDARPYWIVRGGSVRRRSMRITRDQPWRVDAFSFNAVLLPVALVTRVGRLDERFFFFCEDADYSWRCRQAGVSVYNVPAARVFHHILRESRVVDLGRCVVLLPQSASVARIYYGLRNRMVLAVRMSRRPWAVTARYCLTWLLLVVWDLLFSDRKRRLIVARTLALRDALTGRMGRADYPVLYDA